MSNKKVCESFSCDRVLQNRNNVNSIVQLVSLTVKTPLLILQKDECLLVLNDGSFHTDIIQLHNKYCYLHGMIMSHIKESDLIISRKGTKFLFPTIRIKIKLLHLFLLLDKSLHYFVYINPTL